MVAAVTLLCLVTCPSTPAPHLQTVNDEWRTHTANPFLNTSTFTLEGVTFHSPHRGMGSDVDQWLPLVAGHFPPEQVTNALCVIKSESGGNPAAKNPRSNARGLFQIMSSVWGPEFGFSNDDFYTPELNTYAAARIWERSGWTPWSPRTRRNCGL